MGKKKGAPAKTGPVQASIRIPRELHDALCKRREQTGKSLNDLLIEAAANFVGIPVPALPKGIPGRKPRKKVD
jgi:hypothetical protein